jgi:hypothetical protein
MTVRLFILLNFVVNFLQAAFTQLTGDEALYWMYAQNPSIGYRDHPPMIGDYLFHSELGVRIVIVLINALAIFLLWKLTRPGKWWHFALPVLVLPALNLYAFIATPDAPLVFFTVCFLIVFKEFLQNPSGRNQLLLGFMMALLLWSKYHGFLVILLCVLPLYNVWTKKPWWYAVAFGTFLYAPHLIWQIANDLPTIKFHVVKRAGEFEWKHLWGYLGGQLLVLNPVILIMFVVALFRNKSKDSFYTSVKWLALGMPLLFLLSSLRGRVEPHWTVASSIAMLIVVLLSMHVFIKKHRWFYALGFFATILFAARFAMIFNLIPGFQREFHTNKQKMIHIHKFAGELPVCFMNSYQNPSLYRFYTGGISHSVNTTDGGENQYDYWHFGDFVHHQKFLFVSSHERSDFNKSLLPNGREFYYRLDSTLTFLSHLKIITEQWHYFSEAGSMLEMFAVIRNNNHYNIDFTDPQNHISWQVWFNHKKVDAFKSDVIIDSLPDKLEPGEEREIRMRFHVPETFNSLVKGGIAGSINGLPYTYQSNWIRLEPK